MPRILAIDYGEKRTGIAVTDELQIIASGLITVKTGELIKEYKFLSKDFEELMLGNSELKDYCYGLICDACILKYDSKELGIDDVSETDEVVDEL